MHAAFLYHAIRAGLDMGIVNAGQLAVYEEIEPELRERVEDVLLNRRDDATERLVDFAESRESEGERAGAGKGVAYRSGGGTAQACTGARRSRFHRNAIPKKRAANFPNRSRSSKGRLWLE